MQADGSLANATLAERVDLSESTCLRRVKMLEQSGVIERYTAVLNALKVGMSVSFLVRITLKGQTDRDLGAFEQAVCRVPEVASAISPPANPTTCCGWWRAAPPTSSACTARC